MKILHTADLHIGAELSYLDEKSSSRRFEVFEVFKNIIKICKNEKIDICLIAGDLFDSLSAVKEFFLPVIRCIENVVDTRFFYVAGNHDPLYASSLFLTEKLPENLVVFGGEYGFVEIPELKARVAGRSFTGPCMKADLSLKMPTDDFTNILLLHSDFGDKESPYGPITPEFVENCGAHYIALGHIHKRTEIERIGNTCIAYSGCPEGQGFDELGEKGVYIGEIDKNSCNLTFRVCSKRLHIAKKADISSATDTDQTVGLIISALKQEYGEDFGKNLYKLTLTGNLKNADFFNFDELKASLKELLYYVKIKNNIREHYDFKLLAEEISLRGLFVKNMLRKIEVAKEDDRKLLIDALYLGLSAFESEVKFDED